MKLIILASVVLVITGCASEFINKSSGVIGCVPQDIKISELQTGLVGNTASWIAECKGQKYVCSSSNNASTNCTEMK
jgi:hypothetical protein